MARAILLLAVATLSLGGPGPAAHALAGQSIPVGFDVQVGSTRPLQRFDDLGAGPGRFAGVEMLAAFHPRLSAYAGYRNIDQTCEQTPCPSLGPRTTLQETGWVVGLESAFPARGALTPTIRGGLTLHRLKGVDGDAPPPGLGFEGGVGFEVALGTGFALAPRLRYARWSSDPIAGFGSPTERIRVSQASITLGLIFRPYR